MAMIGLGGLAACGNNSDMPEREGGRAKRRRGNHHLGVGPKIQYCSL